MCEGMVGILIDVLAHVFGQDNFIHSCIIIVFMSPYEVEELQPLLLNLNIGQTKYVDAYLTSSIIYIFLKSIFLP